MKNAENLYKYKKIFVMTNELWIYFIKMKLILFIRCEKFLCDFLARYCKFKNIKMKILTFHFENYMKIGNIIFRSSKIRYRKKNSNKNRQTIPNIRYLNRSDSLSREFKKKTSETRNPTQVGRTVPSTL